MIDGWRRLLLGYILYSLFLVRYLLFKKIKLFLSSYSFLILLKSEPKMEEDAETLAKDYSKYLKVDVWNYVKLLEDGINETLKNLEEYARIVDLIRSDSSVRYDAILLKKTELLLLFEKIRKLEIIVNIVKRNVDDIENLVINAETDLKTTTEGKVRSFLKNVVFKKKTESAANASASRRTQTYFVQPNVFSTAELFNSASTSTNC